MRFSVGLESNLFPKGGKCCLTVTRSLGLDEFCMFRTANRNFDRERLIESLVVELLVINGSILNISFVSD